MVYTIQDREQNKLQYIATMSSLAAAHELRDELFEQDEADGCLDRERYVITLRGTCFSDKSKTCGYCTNCVCMADDWETQCPARIMKRINK